MEVSLVHYLTTLIEQYGYFIIFLLTYLECSFFLGLFVPGETTVILGGIFAHQGNLSLSLVLLFSFLGAYLGDITGFYLGYIWGERVVHGIGKRFGYKEKHFKKTHDFFEKWGWIAIILGRYLSLFRSLLPATIGAVKYEKYKYILFDLIGTFLWTLTFVLVGYYLGESWHMVMQYGMWIVVGTFVAGFIVVYYMFREKKHD